MKKRILTSLAAATLLAAPSWADAPRWLRHCAISPDGKTVAFCYKGDIYTVSAAGGTARQLTTHSAYDTDPVWSPDGSRIAFSSDREGPLDVFVMPSEGGVPVRLTATAGKETPVAWKDAQTLLFLSGGRPSVEDMQFPGFQHVYEVTLPQQAPASSYAVPRSRMVSSMPMESISISPDGKTWLYNDYKGYEDPLRKHHTSSITRDIWAYSPADGKYTKQTTFEGEDRNPVWGDGEAFYYLSEESGTFNVHKRLGGRTTQLTRFQKDPVRFLSRAQDGTLCFSQNGDLYTLRDGAEPRKLEVAITNDIVEKDIIRRVQHSGVTDYSVAPSGKEIAFILHGDVYVTSVEYQTTRQITDTPDQERSVHFAPDGKSVVYASERRGLWQIFRTSIDGDEKQMTYAQKLKEENLTQNNQTSFQPRFSPDGKKVAYLENRTTLRIIDLKSKKITTALDGKFNYSYSDGDQYFTWSPDSRWLLTKYIGVGGWNNVDVALVRADGSEVHDLTESGYTDGNPKWVLGGKAMVWSSDRAGYRSHGSWGAEDDYYIMFFDVEAYDQFVMNKEDRALAEEAKSAKEKKEEKKEEEKKEKDEEKGKVPEVEPLEFDLVNAKDRIIRLTNGSANMGDAILSRDGKRFYYTCAFQGSFDLWCNNLEDHSTQRLITGLSYSNLDTDERGETIYFASGGGGLQKLTLGETSPKNIPFEAIFNYRPAEERAYIFDHAWRQVNEKFYDPAIHGLDWEYYHKNYEQFLPHINNNYDFAELLSELLGELNGSHTGARYRPGNGNLSVASLGLFYDDRYEGPGLRIQEIMPKSPLTLKKNDVKPGCVITHIDGQPITPTSPADYLLAGKVGKTITLTVEPRKGKAFEVTVKGISSGAESALLYHRWVERNRHIVDSLSGGRLGYIHIEAMNSASFRVLYSELLGKYRNREAVVIDTRHNGGGWLHDDVVTLLGAKEYARFMPRDQYIGSDPHNKWTKPSCMLVCEDNYSNAHGTPWLYKELGVGKLIGAPVPGTMTAVWWETQIDGTLVFGIPQVGMRDNRGHYLENQQLQPDVLVYNDPADVLRGRDRQLETAVEELLKELKK